MSTTRSIYYPFLLLLLLVCLIEIISCNRGSDYGERAFRRINGNRDRLNNTMLKEPSSKKSPAFRLSAVGIIMFILTIVLSGIFIYYFFLFYPILCRKERNYDVVEHSRDTTPTPNIDNTQ